MKHTVDTFNSPLGLYSLGIHEPSDRLYLSIPVSNGVEDYEEFYELTPPQYVDFLEHPQKAVLFAEECRLRQHDWLLMENRMEQVKQQERNPQVVGTVS